MGMLRLMGWALLGVLLAVTGSEAIPVTFAWNYTGPTPLGFTLRRCTGLTCLPSVSLGLTIGPTDRQATDPNATAGTGYCWDILARGDGTNNSDSAPSTPFCTTVQTPQQPVAITLVWDYSNQSGHTGFNLRRCTGVSCAPSVSLGLTILPSARLATDPNALQGQSYCWDLIALGDGSQKLDSNPSTPLCLTVPLGGIPYMLRWVTQPTNALTNGTLAPVQVEILDQLGVRVPTAALAVTIYVTPGATIAIPNSQVTFNGVDSQETDFEQNDGPRAMDGLTTTFWHTQWSLAQPPYPHWISMDLRTPYNITGFRYLPRQDGEANGTVANYKFYANLTGLPWDTTTLVSQGSFFPFDTTEKTKRFMGRMARYVLLWGDSEINGNPWMSAAEITVLYSNTGAGSVTGTSTVNAVNGLATFSAVQVNAAGTYTLDTDSLGLVQATSTSFTITDPAPPQGPQVRRVVQ